MKWLAKWLTRSVLALVVLAAIFWAVGPYEDATLEVQFDDAVLQGGVSAYLDRVESAYTDITPGVQKRVIWADAPERRTQWAVVYIHGFSATSEEIRPVPDRIAEALGANLVMTRLQGHGRGSDAMAEGTVIGWMTDTAEALAVARAVGERVLVISTSTGGTLVAAAAQNPDIFKSVAGAIFVSPNFGVNSPLAPLLTFPAARYWLPLLAGERRGFEPLNEEQARFWTTEYPSVAALPMGALVQKVLALDMSRAAVPALFWFSDEDRVVDPSATRKVASEWGGPVQITNPELTARDDPYAHVIAGDIISPGQTAAAVSGMLDWVGGL